VENAIGSSSDPWRVRLRGEYQWPIQNLFPISYVFANDEVSYRFHDHLLYRNRFQAGVELISTMSSGLRLYYQRQDDKTNHPGALNVLGAILTINLD
jgi:hypothetical protein